jgi:hypothetical protein
VKLKVLLGALVIGALGAAVALAAPPPGKKHNNNNNVLGATGPSGPSGPHGKGHHFGSNGTLGASGPSGPSGPHGKGHHFGSNGTLGASGPSGPHGKNHGHENAGPKGASGPSGASGASGPSGVSGANGPKTNTTTHGNKPTCVPQVALVVFGTAKADAGSNFLSLNVTGGNHFAKLLFGSSPTTLNVNTTSSTKVTTASGESSTLTSIKNGDRALVLYKVCKSNISGNSPNVVSADSLSKYLSPLSPKKVVDRGQANGQD